MVSIGGFGLRIIKSFKKRRIHYGNNHSLGKISHRCEGKSKEREEVDLDGFL